MTIIPKVRIPKAGIPKLGLPKTGSPRRAEVGKTHTGTLPKTENPKPGIPKTKGIAKGGVKSRNKGAFVSVCLRLSTFARVCLRLLAFSPLRLLAFVCVCLRLLAFAYAPPLLRPPLRDTERQGIPKLGIPKLGIPKMGRFRAPFIQTPPWLLRRELPKGWKTEEICFPEQEVDSRVRSGRSVPNKPLTILDSH